MDTVKFGKLTIMPDYGRILKLEPVEGVNVFWNNPSSEKTAYGWFNPGGDRIWISPESEFFMPGGTDENYFVPEGMDPGKYSTPEISDNVFTMKADISVDFLLRGKSMDLKLTRKISELESDAPDGVAFAGYKQESVLTAAENFTSELRPALWSIVQLPAGGKITFPAGKTVKYSGEVPHYDIVDGKISFSLPAENGSFKLGVPSDHTRGVMAYMNLSGNQPYLVIRNFSFVKNGRYADAPLGSPDTPCAQQFYFDDGNLGGFGEMEYHTEYLTPENPSINDVSYLRAYVGDADKLRNILEKAFK